MQRWIVLIIAICVSTAVYFTIRYGLRPKPIPVMNPTAFEAPEQIGIVIYKRLRQNIRAERLLILGTTPGVEDDIEVWNGLVKAAIADGETVDFIALNETGTDREAVYKRIHESIKSRKLVVLRGVTTETSHFMKDSWSKELDRAMKHPVLAISTLRLAVKPEEYDDLQKECLDPQEEDGQRRLDCAAQKVARKFLKRKLAPDKIWAVMERHGLKEYLVFIHRPAAAAAPAAVGQ